MDPSPGNKGIDGGNKGFDVNFVKYNDFITTKWNAGTKKLSGPEYAKKVFSNLSQNVKAFSNKVQNYFSKQTEGSGGSLSGEWIDNKKVFDHIQKKLSNLDKELEVNRKEDYRIGSKTVLETISSTIDDLQTIFKSMDKTEIAKTDQGQREIGALKQRFGDLKSEVEEGLDSVDAAKAHKIKIRDSVRSNAPPPTPEEQAEEKLRESNEASKAKSEEAGATVKAETKKTPQSKLDHVSNLIDSCVKFLPASEHGKLNDLKTKLNADNLNEITNELQELVKDRPNSQNPIPRDLKRQFSNVNNLLNRR